MTHPARTLHNAWLGRACASRLRQERSGRSGTEQMLDLAYSFDCRGVSIAPFQRRGEIAALMAIVERERPSTVLEIGTANGGTLFLLARCASADATLISVDLEGGPYGGGYPPWRVRLYEAFADAGQRVVLLRGDSHLPGTRDGVRALLAGRALDLLFIDGDHSYEGVSRDLGLYGPLVREGGLVALHDIVPGPEDLVGGVPRLWAELKGRHDHEELIVDREQGGFGIGVIRQGPSSEGPRGGP
jgi:predicted O-methyltransferase YrrM